MGALLTPGSRVLVRCGIGSGSCVADAILVESDARYNDGTPGGPLCHPPAPIPAHPPLLPLLLPLAPFTARPSTSGYVRHQLRGTPSMKGSPYIVVRHSSCLLALTRTPAPRCSHVCDGARHGWHRAGQGIVRGAPFACFLSVLSAFCQFSPASHVVSWGSW